MEKALAPFAPYAYAIIRLIVGLLFVSHAGQKLFGWFGGRPFPLGSLLGLAGMINSSRPAHQYRALHQLCRVYRQR
jgi:putative oxidoreductase